MEKPIKIIRKDDNEVFKLQSEGNYANVITKEMGSTMRWELEHFSEKFFKFIYE